MEEVREYPRDENPFDVALWRDQCLTLQEHRAVLAAMKTPTSVSSALSTMRHTARMLQEAQEAHATAMRNLARAQEYVLQFSEPEYLHSL